MKIIFYSDLHLEFGYDWRLPTDVTADVLVLAGDIITFRDPAPLLPLLRDWQKPVLFVAGNHEYYRASIKEHRVEFKAWLRAELPQVHFLDNEAVCIGGVQFFGGTMWTDFDSMNDWAMQYARQNMSDFELIRYQGKFTPKASTKLHRAFVTALEKWFTPLPVEPRVVITHHVPVVDPNTKYAGSPLSPTFVCSDMLPLIEKYQPDVWIYGHTHECGAHMANKTRLLSNQLGYIRSGGLYECWREFDKYGCGFDLG